MIRVTDLKKQFDKRGIAGLNGLSFTLDKGKVMAIMGPNGSGKTSLLKILSGLVIPESGQTEIDGPVSTFSIDENFIDQNVQKFLIASVTLDIDEEKKLQLARDLADTFEFTFQLRQRLSELSSGQKQKILLAKELINRPAILLMDEPFGHLDPYTRRDILKGLFTYIKDQSMTVLWVTHDLDEAFQFSDVIGLMNFGKFEQMSSPLTMVTKPKNLFVARFMGYRNFFPVRFEGDKWSSIWGSFDYKFDSEEAIVVIPDYAWKTGEGLSALISEKHAGKQTIDYILQIESRKTYMVQGAQKSQFSPGESLRIRPIWDECFLIPL